VALRAPLPPGPVAARAEGSPQDGPADRGPVRWLVRAPAPAKLRVLAGTLVALCCAWGAVGAWTVNDHAAAAGDVVSTSEPLSLRAQQMYQSLADADVTVTTAFLSGPDESLDARNRYQSDVTQAATDLSALKEAAASGPPGQARSLEASLDAVAAGLPVYTGDVAEAQTDYTLGFPLTGGSFMQVASEEMHVTLLPAARSSYLQENARLAAASSAATGLAWIIVTLVLGVVTGLVLYGTQRWLTRRTHRVINYGLLVGSVALLLCTAWLVIAFLVARADLQHGVGRGAAPAESLAQAETAVAQGRGDELLNLISRSGDASFEQNFRLVRTQIGPGPGSLLNRALASSGGTPGAASVAAAERDAQAWYAANEQVYRLDVAANYAAETQLVLGTGPGSSAAGFDKLEADLSQAITADQVVFQTSASAGAGAFTGLEAGVLIAALLMAVGCAWGLNRRLEEYRG
jgi:hypothetical protein